jgi:hypothetical protein
VSKATRYQNKSILNVPLRILASKFIASLHELLRKPLFAVSYFTSALLCLFSGHSFLALSFLALCTFARPDLVWRMHGLYRATLQRYRLDPVLLTGIVFGLLAGVVLGLSFVEPSHAQFFKNAEDFIGRAFNGGTNAGVPANNNTDIVKLVMNTLRLLFVMYMLFGIVQVFQAVRQGEEWKDLARTPFFVVLAGTLGDVLVGAIAGTGTGP